jgi:hypothetical protein
VTLTVQQITERLEAVEKDLDELQEPYSGAAEAWVRADREWELRMVRGKFAIKAETQTEKKDRALDALSVAEDGIYQKHVDAQAEFEGMRAAVKVLETRATIGMALLKSQRELGG